ncbi:hypothetical protein SPRG_03985 [Saprolegnia parasitica CBS 223.65]|uniref:Uncharacterized protein n=1 Tax=Saprolegnia parasitica (strain CBS 223.65) TaxID=695850 RepID=A0A067CLH9_SAPPC|nr:hypothetical protein SPRG_03985 [Saprolegnia parasitica CBS 223.65]KDO31368.1 hypothetical protein SPRG_03985 [Saprolegnia parasitica CBS 223.65]|eukprot:XP_012197965.1 hypothetical protein SPRG_03985 [Saprolegnia parasitica CBS 223.65]
MSEFFRRALSQLLNEAAVKTLANNKSFQNFALKTHLHVEKTKAVMNNLDVEKVAATKVLPNVNKFTEITEGRA